QAFELFLRVWYAKTDDRTHFLALQAEQKPLDPKNKVAGGSKLGENLVTNISEPNQITPVDGNVVLC
ncbi:hypothetical protein DFH28DRAFT_882991, partial [Melampsora americana]